MSDKKRLYDRREVALDDKFRALDLSQMNLVPPEVGICDPPLRVYPLNNEWAKIVMGLVSWLATIAPWRDAEDEGYIGIQEVLTFMIGCDPCEALAGCFEIIVDTPYDELSEELQRLRDAMKKVADMSGTPSVPSVYGANPALIAEGSGCDPDNLFAAITGLVDYAYWAIVDLVQIIEANTGILETMRDVIGAIPIFETLPFDEFFSLIDVFLENVGQNFLAAYTQALRDEYRCDLFCIARDDCSLFFVQAMDYFAGRFQITFSEIDLQDFIEFFIQGVLSGEELVHAAHALFFGVLAFGGTFVGDTADHFARAVQAMFNDSDPDWSVLCGCIDPEYDVAYVWEANDFKGWTVVDGVQPLPGAVYLRSYPNQPGGHHVTVERYFQPFDGLQWLYALGSYVAVSNTHQEYGVHIRIVHSSGEFQGYWEGAVTQTTPFHLPTMLHGVSYITVTVREDLIADGGTARLGGIRLTGVSYNQPPDPSE